MNSTSISNNGSLALAALTTLPYPVFCERLLQEVATHGRVSAYFAAPNPAGGLDLYAVIARDWQGELHLLRSQIDDRFPSLTPQCPQLHLFEREIAEQYGVIPEGHPWFKPVRFQRSYRTGRDAWGRPAGHPVAGAIDFFRVEGEEVHEVAVGPVHAGVIEPGHFRFQCHGEAVLHLEISLGYQHRGMEALLLQGPHGTTFKQIEALAGDTTIGHGSAYCQLLESLSRTTIPPRAAALRSIALELERLANHVGDIGALSGDVGFLPTASFCGRLRGDYLNLTAEFCGSRFGRGLLTPGGVMFDLTPEQVQGMLEKLALLEQETRGAIELFFVAPSVLARLEGTGRVSVDTAESLGLVGVAARACGLTIDARLHHPHGPYLNNFYHATIEEDGDVFARASIRRREIYDSLDWIRNLLRHLPSGDIRQPLPALKPECLSVALVEGWRGEVVHVALTDAQGRFARYKVVDPSFRNWSGLAMALRNEQISDFPLCNKSFNLSYCGFDL